MPIVITGSLAYDYIMDFPGRFADRIMPDKIHQLSLSFLVQTLKRNFGGTAGNLAYTLKLLGIDAQVLAFGGNDFSFYEKHWQKYALNSVLLKIDQKRPTSSYFGITDEKDNQIGAFYPGSLLSNRKLSLRSIKPKPKLVVIGPNDPQAMINYVDECLKLKLPYFYDPAFQIDTFSQSQLERTVSGAQLLIGNDYEIALIEKKLSLQHQELVKLIPLLITTLGEKGSIIESMVNGQIASVKIKPAKPKNTSDPTGAGDAYRAGFLAGYLRDFNLTTCGQMGSLAAVYTVEKYGTQTHAFTRRQFCARYKKNFGQSLKL